MAYLVDVHVPSCYRCRKVATRILKNRRNEEIAHYCGKCAPKALAEFELGERRRDEVVSTTRSDA